MQCDGDGVERWPCRLQDVGLSCDGVFRKSHRLVAHYLPTRMVIYFKADSARVRFIPAARSNPGSDRPTRLES